MRSSLGKVTVPFSMQIDIGVQKYLVAVEWIGIAHSCCENPVTWIPSMDDITACDQVHANRLRPRSKPSPIGPTETTSAGRKPLQKSAKQKITQLRPNKHSVQLWALPLGNACYSSAIEAAISSGLNSDSTCFFHETCWLDEFSWKKGFFAVFTNTGTSVMTRLCKGCQTRWHIF